MALSIYFWSERDPSNRIRRMALRSAFDRIDFAILAALQKDGRLSNKELAARVGLAPSSCLVRVRALQKSGVLRGFSAAIDPSALGIGVNALAAVKLARHARELLHELFAHLRALPEVLAIFYLSGANDLLVHVAVRDIEHLRDLITDAFATRPEVGHCETSVIFEHYES